jgi:hypothetical protein
MGAPAAAALSRRHAAAIVTKLLKAIVARLSGRAKFI